MQASYERKGLYTFRTKNGCIPMYTLKYDVSEIAKQFEIDQSAVMNMNAILDFVSITCILKTTQHRNTVFSAPF